MSGSIPNAGEGGVRLEEVCHDLRAINTELVASNAANENQTKASGGADGKKRVHGNVLELLQGGVGLEGVRDVLCRLSIKPVVAQTASESQKETSGGADSRRTVCCSVLERDQDRILFEIICQKHGVPNFEAIVQEIRLHLV